MDNTENLKNRIRLLKQDFKMIGKLYRKERETTATLSGEIERLQAEITRLQVENKRMAERVNTWQAMTEYWQSSAQVAHELLKIQRGNVPPDNHLQVIQGGNLGKLKVVDAGNNSHLLNIVQ